MSALELAPGETDRSIIFRKVMGNFRGESGPAFAVASPLLGNETSCHRHGSPSIVEADLNKDGQDELLSKIAGSGQGGIRTVAPKFNLTEDAQQLTEDGRAGSGHGTGSGDGSSLVLSSNRTRKRLRIPSLEPGPDRKVFKAPRCTSHETYSTLTRKPLPPDITEVWLTFVCGVGS